MSTIQNRFLKILVFFSSFAIAVLVVYCSHTKTQQQTNLNKAAQNCEKLGDSLKSQRMYMYTTKSGPSPEAESQYAEQEKKFREQCPELYKQSQEESLF